MTSTKIAPKAVTADKLGAAAVTSAKIALGAITADKVAFYNHVIVVAPSGGNFTSPVAALNSITDASETNPYLVKIMPGVYDIGGGTVQMKPYVSIEGSGAGATQILGTQNTCDENPAVPGGLAPPLRRGDRERQCLVLRSVSVRNNGASTEACAVVAILASDCDGMGIFDVGAQARGTNINVGIMVRHTVVADWNSWGSSTRMSTLKAAT